MNPKEMAEACLASSDDAVMEKFREAQQIARDAMLDALTKTIRDAGNFGYEAALREIEEASKATNADVVLRTVARDMRFRFDRATADD